MTFLFPSLNLPLFWFKNKIRHNDFFFKSPKSHLFYLVSLPNKFWPFCSFKILFFKGLCFWLGPCCCVGDLVGLEESLRFKFVLDFVLFSSGLDSFSLVGTSSSLEGSLLFNASWARISSQLATSSSTSWKVFGFIWKNMYLVAYDEKQCFMI